MNGLIWRERHFLLLQARRGLANYGIILTLFFARCVGLTAGTENLFDGITGLRHGAAETDRKEECEGVKGEGVGDEQELRKDWIVALDEAWRVVEANEAGLDDLQGALCYDQDQENGEAWETANNPIEEGHGCRSWRYREKVYAVVCIGVEFGI